MIKKRKKIFLWTLWHEGQKLFVRREIQDLSALSMYLSSKGVRLWTVYQGFGAVTKEIGTPQERRVEINWRTL
jgi:hypothetical protein